MTDHPACPLMSIRVDKTGRKVVVPASGYHLVLDSGLLHLKNGNAFKETLNEPNFNFDYCAKKKTDMAL